MRFGKERRHSNVDQGNTFQSMPLSNHGLTISDDYSSYSHAMATNVDMADNQDSGDVCQSYYMASNEDVMKTGNTAPMGDVNQSNVMALNEDEYITANESMVSSDDVATSSIGVHPSSPNKDLTCLFLAYSREV